MNITGVDGSCTASSTAVPALRIPRLDLGGRIAAVRHGVLELYHCGRPWPTAASVVP
ncbi:MAG TPA: hypothetical protein VGH96_22840 [Streptosporangiaceae bacterium]|jgi:hypothetical protein